MGFTEASLATNYIIKAANEFQQSQAFKAQAQATGMVGEAQARLMENQASLNDAIAMDNDRMRRRNARNELSAVRVDNAASNLMSDGTGLSREIDMATRLEREINTQTDAALRQGHNLRSQAAYTRWDAGIQAQNLRRQAHGNKMSALGNLVGAVATIGVGAYSQSTSTKKKS